MQGHIAQHQTKITEEQLKKVGSETCNALEQLNSYYHDLAKILLSHQENTEADDIDQAITHLKRTAHSIVKWDTATIPEQYANEVLVTKEEYEDLPEQAQDEASQARLQELQRLTKKLRDAFARETTDLKLYFDFHNQEHRGSPYDDVDGPFFVVTGYYEKSDGAEVLESLVGELEDVSYVDFV